MSSRMLKLLTASSAFVAATAAVPAYAVTISTSSTTPLHTSTTVGPIVITGTGSIVPPISSSAIYISSTNPVSNTITIQNGGRITNNYGGSATIVSDNAANGAVSITNNGIIVDSAGTGAIDLGNIASNATINNAFGISGSITLGTGTNNLTNSGLILGDINMNGSTNTLNSTGETEGTITGSSGTDNVTFTNAIHTGNISLVGGTNTLTVSNSEVTGNYTGGASGDNITINNNSIYTGNIALGVGTDTLSVNNARVNGNITSSAGGTGGQTNITLTNATVSGTITDGTTNDNDNLVITGTRAFTTMGQIEGMEHVSIQTDANLNHNIVGAQTLNVASGKTVNVNSNFNTGGLLTNAGNLNINAGHTVGAQSYVGTGGTLGIGIASSDTTVGAGKIAITNGALAAGTSVTISMGNNVGYLTSGTQYVIATGDGVTAAGVANLRTSNTGVYRYSTSVSNTSSVVLNIGRVSTDSVASTDNNKAAGVAVDSLATSNNADMIRMHSLIGAQTTEAGVNNVLEALSPGIDGAGAASVNITIDTGNQVSYRLASLRSDKSGVATGDPMSSNHMWIEGFGSMLSQDDTKDGRGYDATSGGVSVGMDTDTLINGVTTGLALSYGMAQVESNASNNANTDISTYVATLYGSRVFDNGMFVNGQLGAGYNQYDMERTVAGLGTAEGSTNGIQGTIKLETGRDFALDNLIITPLLGVQYTYLDMDSYEESGAATLQVTPDAMSMIDTSVGLQASYAIPLYSGSTLKPSIHARYIYRLGDDSFATTSRFTAGGTAFATNGVKADKSSINVGGGLLLNTVYGTDLSLNYDADIRSNFIAHSGQLKARVPF